MSIYFDNRQDTMDIGSDLTEILERAIDIALENEGIDFSTEVSVSFVGNEEIQELNREYRDKDQTTDVLSFPLVEREELCKIGQTQGEILLGDIIISIPKTIKQSEEYGHSFLRELTYLTVHGIHHLLGYDHMSTDEKSIMRKKEKEVMEVLNIKRIL